MDRTERNPNRLPEARNFSSAALFATVAVKAVSDTGFIVGVNLHPDGLWTVHYTEDNGHSNKGYTIYEIPFAINP